MSEVGGKKAPRRRVARAAGEAGAGKKLRSPLGNQRSAFLRRCRARLSPAEVGLPEPQRSRTTGLRREDVAALAGVSASWYTWLEQGREIRVSDDFLERLCRTLRLSEDERIYLFSLVQHRLPRLPRDPGAEAPAEVVRMVHALNVPAIAMNLRWDVLAWNPIHNLFYRDYGAMPVGERNLLEVLFTRPVRHMTPEQLEVTARRLIARLRFDYSKSTDDPKLEALVYRLNATSPLFSRIWRTPEFTLRSFGPHRFTHARYGQMLFEHTSCVPDGHPQIRVVICAPADAATLRAVAQANAGLASAGA